MSCLDVRRGVAVFSKPQPVLSAASASDAALRFFSKPQLVQALPIRMPTSPSTRKTEHPWIQRSRAAGRPLVFAHRGGAALAPENTLAAFEHAHALGVDGFELDVRLSRDGEVMVFHDADVERTTNGKGRVSALTAEELRTLDAGSRFKDSRGPHGEGARGDTRIPLLRDVLARFPEELLIVELKGASPALPPRAFEIVREAGALDRVCFGGFQRHMLIGVRRCGRRHASDRTRAPMVCSSASREETRWSLYRSWVRMPWPWRPYDTFQVPEVSRRTRVVTPEFVRAAHARGLLVQVWTVNDEPSMRRLLEWGVDGLISDRPDLALRARDAFASTPR
jgi:glycerophosphoryl diester phosphodiesterase